MTCRALGDLRVWGSAQDLAVAIYRCTGEDPVVRDFGFRDQIRRAAVSISSNIAEGFGRGGDAEFLRFLDIARGSAQEVASLLHLGIRLGYFPPAVSTDLLAQIDRILGGLAGLQNHLRRSRTAEPAEVYQP